MRLPWTVPEILREHVTHLSDVEGMDRMCLEGRTAVCCFS